MSDGGPIPAALLERVAACAAGITAVDRLGAEVERLRAREQSTVLEYRFAGGLRLIAKRYARREDALASYDVLRVLWQQGFGPGSSHRVPEPLGCFADWGVLLMRVAPGHRLPDLAAQPGAWEDGLRAAGAWLARLHVRPVVSGPRADTGQDVLRLAQRAAEVSARHPELEHLLAGMMGDLAERARSIGAAQMQTHTHGRYHARHVFVAPEHITVIDLDRAALAHPAKDLGEFLHRLRAQARSARLGDGAAEQATYSFLEGYAAHAHAVPGGLGYHWSYSILSSLLRVVELKHAKWEKRLEFYRAEFEDVPRRAGTLTRLAR